jgi:hypothetical protein
MASIMRTDMKGRLGMQTKLLPWRALRHQCEIVRSMDPKFAVKATYVDKPTSAAARLFLEVRPFLLALINVPGSQTLLGVTSSRL